MIETPVKVRVTRHPQRQEGGSSSTTLGEGACRSWCVTVLWSSGCLAVTLVKSGSISALRTSLLGPDGFKTLDSLRS